MRKSGLAETSASLFLVLMPPRLTQEERVNATCEAPLQGLSGALNYILWPSFVT
jgi:hypothetical protein